MKITIVQLDPTIGDIKGNFEKLKQVVIQHSNDSELLVFPELFITGYPPRDLLEKEWFMNEVQKALNDVLELSKRYSQIGIIFGVPMLNNKNDGKGLYNSALLVHNGKILLQQNKSLLPTYDVFDEARYFDPGEDVKIVSFKGEILGISVCEDAWNDPDFWIKRVYPQDPMEILAKKGATLFINISASPFCIGKEETRYEILKNHARKWKIPFLYVNQVGANDELIFDGRSVFVDNQGMPVDVLSAFREVVKTIDTKNWGEISYKPQDRIETVYDALVIGIRDYARKCGFSKAVIGLSGGIDSAVTCCLASEALGKKNVLGVAMPSQFSSGKSEALARKLAENIGVEFRIVPITPIYEAYKKSLKKPLNMEEGIDITLENVQARIRGNILMSFSNKFGHLVLSTGNKSELAVGYCTLYGDMSGGLAVISDVPKTMVYKLAQYINMKREIIPKEIIERPPSAELKPDQKDQDTLPPYEILDKILQFYIDEGFSAKEIISKGFKPETVKWVIKAVNRSEYKRRQAAPGLKVTSKAFGIGRRMVIAAKYDF